MILQKPIGHRAKGCEFLLRPRQLLSHVLPLEVAYELKGLARMLRSPGYDHNVALGKGHGRSVPYPHGRGASSDAPF